MSATETKTVPSKGQKQAADISALLRARNPLIWIITTEEARVEGFIAEAASAAGYQPLFWDAAAGVSGLDGKAVQGVGSNDCGETLAAIRVRADAPAARDATNRTVWVMRDLPKWLDGMIGAGPTRQLRNLARYLPGVKRDNAQAIIILTTSKNVPDELAGHTTVIEWSMPDRSEIAAILDAALASLPEKDSKGNVIRANAAPNGTRDLAIDAAVGLTGEEAASCYARSLVQTRKIDPAIIANEKKRIVSRERVLEWHDPLPGGLDCVGGLENLKSWLVARKSAYSAKAREYGLPAPKGAVLVGVPGCGKSLTAKAIATAWGVPLLRLDLGALKSKFVGDSEGNLRKALKVIEAIGRCVVWIDEIEKALQGATSGSADGGVSSDALGTILSWMQERTGEAFVIATANDVESLPPEILRKGRFDEVFFIDTPNASERVAVMKASLKAFGRGEIEVDYASLSKATDKFTGSEIAALVPEALFLGFNDGAREITTEDLLQAASTVVPLVETAKDKIMKLREWAKTKARSATAKEDEASAFTGSREVDFEA